MRFALLTLWLLPFAASANPTGGTVTSGSATISSSGSTLTVTTSTNGTVINWNSFSINAGETTRINQPNVHSATLNRVTGGSSSSINGSLQSNGQVFLINPNGIVFGATASVNVGGFVGSTLDISDADFLAGNLRFTGTTGSIVNEGSIVASTYFVALIAPNLQSTGTLVGPSGIALAAGDPVTISYGPGFVIDGVIVGGNLGGTGAMQISGTLTGPVFISVDGTGAFSPGGDTLPSLPIIDPAPITGSGTIAVIGGTGTPGNVTLSGTTTTGTAGVIGSIAAAASGGAVLLQGAQVAPTGGPAAGVALNLEKREVSF